MRIYWHPMVEAGKELENDNSLFMFKPRYLPSIQYPGISSM
jgi:hypothetical protein